MSEFFNLGVDHRVTAIVSSDDRGVLDVIANWFDPQGTVLTPSVSELPTCFAPEGANPTIGETVEITYEGLIPELPVHGLLGPDEIAQGIADNSGSGVLEYVVPDDTRNGRHLVTIGTDGTALTADCFLEVNNG